MKVFVSHQRADSEIATQISRRLNVVHSIDTYLDIIEPQTYSDGYELAEHIKKQLDNCTQLLAVISEVTRTSWWVPWEIGVASEKDYPLATYAETVHVIPEYLQKWPYLKSLQDLDHYASASKSTDASFIMERRYAHTSADARKKSTRDFYKNLRAKLNQ